MVSKGTQDFLINLGIVVLVIVVIYVVIIRNPKALDWLRGIGSKTGAAVVGAATIGQTVPGPNVYPVVGQITPPGEYGLSVASGGTSFRDNVSFDCSKCNRETTWFFIPGTEGDMSIKMGSHGDEIDPTVLISLGNIPTITAQRDQEKYFTIILMNYLKSRILFSILPLFIVCMSPDSRITQAFTPTYTSYMGGLSAESVEIAEENVTNVTRAAAADSTRDLGGLSAESVEIAENNSNS